jgi:hypothetical protein
MSRRSRNGEVRELNAYLEGEVTASERETLEAKLRDSAEARRIFSQLESVRALLSAPATRLEHMDLTSRVLARARELGPLAEARPAHARRFALPGLIAAACAAAACFVLLLPHQKTLEFREKSNGAALESARWAAVHVFRATGQAASVPLTEQLRADEGLVFTYTNLGEKPYRYLMIFSVDAANQVRWFYPAYDKAGENPESIPIEGGRANATLGELVQQDFSEGPLAVYALFTSEPERVLQIEAWLNQLGRAPDQAPRAGDLLQRFATRVER